MTASLATLPGAAAALAPPAAPARARALPAPAAAAGAPAAVLTAAQKRAANPAFVPTWSLEALRPQLPFVIPVAEALPPSPKP